MIEWMILLVISHQRHSVLMHHSAIFILRTESYKTIAMHCRQKTICISTSFPSFFMIPTVFNSQEAHLSNGIRTRKNGYVLAGIWSAQAESKKHCNSFVRHCSSSRSVLASSETSTTGNASASLGITSGWGSENMSLNTGEASDKMVR